MSARIFIEAIGMDQLEDGVSGGVRRCQAVPGAT